MHESLRLVELPTTDEAVQLRRQAVRSRGQRARGWEAIRQPFGDELVEAYWLRHIFEPVLAEISELDLPRQRLRGELTGGGGDDHLPAVRRGADASHLVDGKADVVPVGERDLSRMDARPHANLPAAWPRVLQQGVLQVGRRAKRCVCTGEDRKHRVTLRAEDGAIGARDRVADQAAVLLEERAVVRARLREEPRRALDIGEEERDRPGRELRHRRARWRPASRTLPPPRLMAAPSIQPDPTRVNESIWVCGRGYSQT